MMYKSLPIPTVYAHRGASAHAPENTQAAFELAVQLDAPAIELDAKLSADGEIVVIHDQTVNRTTNGVGTVNKLPLAALRELDAGVKFNQKFIGEKIPTLAEVLEAVGNKVFINIELTNYSSPSDALPDKVAELVIHHGLQERVMFSSFFGFTLKRIRRIVPSVPLGLLISTDVKGNLNRLLYGRSSAFQAHHHPVVNLTKSLIEKNHRAGRRILAYTVNDSQTMRRLFNLGIDGIFTDDPALALKVLAEN